MANSLSVLLGSAVLAVGIAGAGFLGGEALVKSREIVPNVTVKGLSERDVRADLAIWPIKFIVVGNELSEVQGEIRLASQRISQFLANQGFTEGEYRLAELEVQDLLTNAYRSGPVDNRFIISQLIIVRTDDVDKVEVALRNTGQLLEAGVVFSSDYQTQPNYLFTRLNDLKPEMLNEATIRAREAADEFARDAGMSVGTIQRANQGVFEILPALETESSTQLRQIDKRLRVVSTITYELEK